MSDEGGPGATLAMSTAAERFSDLVGRHPEGIWGAPGRVNLIGEHTDYNAGLALPFAIDRATVVAAARRPDRTVRVYSTNLDEQACANLDELADWDPGEFVGWSRYALGVLWAIKLPPPGLPGVDIVVSSDVPLRSGLSSSAALTVGIAVALDDIWGLGLDRQEIAKIAQQAEAGFAGTPCGLMDQLAALEGKPGAAVLIDFLSLTTELVPLEVGPLVVLNTRVEHANADGAYADRRRACETAAARLGVPSLRQATLTQVEQELNGQLQKRARHVVTENERVKQTVARLRQNAAVGDLLVSSHMSLRDDYEVSCPELDLAVETALANGATGARLTGAGLGGCAIALGTGADVLAVPLSKAFAEAGFRPPELFTVSPSRGAGRLA
ncbi:MAG TPA: galactokinase [Acidimicrobiales bacterium]|nr:galactokinase [Acidimicrobiales bacterium]